MAVSLEPVVKVSDKLKDLLNKAIARETPGEHPVHVAACAGDGGEGGFRPGQI